MGTTENERTRSELESLFANNSSGNISAQDTRDLIATAQGGYWANQYTGLQTFPGSGTTGAPDWGGTSEVVVAEGVDVSADGASLVTDESGYIEVQRQGVYEIYADIYDASTPDSGNYTIGIYTISDGLWTPLLTRVLTPTADPFFMSLKLVREISASTVLSLGLSNDSGGDLDVACTVTFSMKRLG